MASKTKNEKGNKFKRTKSHKISKTKAMKKKPSKKEQRKENTQSNKMDNKHSKSMKKRSHKKTQAKPKDNGKLNKSRKKKEKIQSVEHKNAKKHKKNDSKPKQQNAKKKQSKKYIKDGTKTHESMKKIKPKHSRNIKNITDIHRNKDMQTAKKRLHKRLNSKTERTKQNNPKKDAAIKEKKPALITNDNASDIWDEYVSKFGTEPDTASQLQSFTKTNCKYNTLSYTHSKKIYDQFSSKKPIKVNSKKERDKIYIERDISSAKKRLNHRLSIQLESNINITEDGNGSVSTEYDSDTDSASLSNDDDDEIQPVAVNINNTTKRKHESCHSSFVIPSLARPQTARNLKFRQFSGQRIVHHSASILQQRQRLRPQTSKLAQKSSYHTDYSMPSIFHKFTSKHKLKRRGHKKTDSVLSVLSQLSTVNRSIMSPRFHHSAKASFLSNIDGPFSILPEIDSEQELLFSALDIDEEKTFYPIPEYDDEDLNDVDIDKEDLEQTNIRIETPINAAAEIFGNFLGAWCGHCVPVLHVIASVEAADSYDLLPQYAATIDQSGNAHTLLVYEELDGVSLSHLRQQLEVVQINIHYNENASNSSTTTQERIQKYFVSVVRKTFGMQLPHCFSIDGRSMIRDAGFIFAIDMFLFNINRFPVSLPFAGKANANNLFISTDEDGDSALYGLCNRFMGGHDLIDMPSHLLNTSNSMKLLLEKERQCTDYIATLQEFLAVLSDYYQKEISPNIQKGAQNSSNGQHTKITHKECIDHCLLPIANYLYIHCGFELIIIDEYNNNPNLMSIAKDDGDDGDDDEHVLKVLEVYRNKLIDNMITLLCEGILIGISEISDQLETKDIDTIIQDIKALDENMFGIQLISAEFLKSVLAIFHSITASFQLNIEDIEDSLSDQENDNDDAREVVH